MRTIQYKILNNVLLLNKKLYFCRITNSVLFSLCGSTDETPLHLLYECNSV